MLPTLQFSCARESPWAPIKILIHRTLGDSGPLKFRGIERFTVLGQPVCLLHGEWTKLCNLPHFHLWLVGMEYIYKSRVFGSQNINISPYIAQ